MTSAEQRTRCEAAASPRPLATTRPRSGLALALAAGLAVVAAGCGPDGVVLHLADDGGRGLARPAGDGEADLNPRLLRRFAALPPPERPTGPLADLGRMLYFEPLLSATGEVSCNTCHPLDAYGATATPVSVGVHGRRGTRNAPSTYHAAAHLRQFWDGRAPTLEKQIEGPLANPVEMSLSEAELGERLRGIAGYRDAFARAFPARAQPIELATVAAAIAEFERGLVTPSRWDDYLRGDVTALTPAEKAGARVFTNLGCVVCHTGSQLGGTTFEKAGVHVPWPNTSDRGRMDVTHEPADDMVFKVPSLRNVARTAPYFHDGSAPTLATAIAMMGRHQLGVELAADEVAAIATFLACLTGPLPDDYIRPPVLPEARRP